LAIFGCQTSQKSAAASPAITQKSAEKDVTKPAANQQATAVKATAAKKTAKDAAQMDVNAAAQPKTDASPKNDSKKTAAISPTQATEKAPAKFAVRLETTKGNIDIDFHREWAPRGADRFFNLVKLGYYSDVAFFRVIPGFMAQVGISGSPESNVVWRAARITDDPVKQSNTRGMVTFATSGPNSRTTQFFINFKNNARLDGMGFAPVGKVRDGSLATVDSLHGGYGEGAPRGRGPNQGRLQKEGNTYLRADFPSLDYIKKASILKQ
jgi:peptidyl-prolyl cis-trans isomerase A (cyclophilin A)